METVRPAAVSSSSTSSSSTRSGLLRSVAAKFGRARKGAQPKDASDAKAKLHQKKQEYLDEYTASVVFSKAAEDNLKIKPLQVAVQSRREDDDEELAHLLARVFTSISAIKAAYAKIQVAQVPYDPVMIQEADVAVVDELKRISQLKHGFYQSKQQKKQFLLTEDDGAASSLTEAEIMEKKNLVKTYEITAKKLEEELQGKDGEVAELRERMMEIDKKNRALEHRLRHPRQTTSSSDSSPTPPTMSTLEGLHLSGLAPTHFLVALRYAVRAVKDFVGVLVREMEKAQWDLAIAAAAIAPCAVVTDGAEAWNLAFQSYVCMGMFSDFHLGPGFAAPAVGSGDKASSSSASTSATADRRRQCFEEFVAGRSCTSAKDLARLRRPFAEFCRTKYSAIVRPQMEAAFFAGMDRRAMADAELFVSFAEMSRRVWLLHWLFCSFEPEARASLFRVEPGTLFSEVYMDSVGAASPDAAEVGFTVVPGFRLRGMVIQSKVYLAAAASGGGA